MLTASENAPFIVGFCAVGFGGDIAAVNALHHDQDAAQANIHELQRENVLLQHEMRVAAHAPQSVRFGAQQFLRGEINKNQQRIAVETKHLPWAPNILEDVGICAAIPLLGATVLTAASSSLRYWHYRRQNK